MISKQRSAGEWIIISAINYGHLFHAWCTVLVPLYMHNIKEKMHCCWFEGSSTSNIVFFLLFPLPRLVAAGRPLVPLCPFISVFQASACFLKENLWSASITNALPCNLSTFSCKSSQIMQSIWHQTTIKITPPLWTIVRHKLVPIIRLISLIIQQVCVRI